MKSFAGLLLLAVAISASEVKKVVKETKVSYGGKDAGYASSKIYYGQYNGKCGNDGFYFNDGNSFVICSNGNAYIQPCAPGSKNSGYNRYQSGLSYGYRDFCDVNLVDDGYNVKHGHGQGYGYNTKSSYGHGPSYGYNPGYAYNAGYNAGYGHPGYGHPGYAYNGYNNAHGLGYGGRSYGGEYKRTEYSYEAAPKPSYKH